jgi:hypothetical protein
MKDLVPLFQSLLWISFAFILILIFRPEINLLRKVLVRRLEGGSEFGLGPIKIGKLVAEMTHRQNAMESQVKVLRLLVTGLVTSPAKDHMRGLAAEGPFFVWFHHDMMAELKHLDALRYVLPNQGGGLNNIYERHDNAEKFNLKQYVHITDSGREYLRLLDQLSSSDQ